MRIAVPVVEKTGVLAEIFSQAGAFALYDVHDDTRAVAYLGREMIAEPCCGGTPRTLRQKGVEVVMAHAISERAEGNLRGLGVVTIKDAPLLSADALLAHLVSGTLQATAPTIDGAPAPQGACGGGGGAAAATAPAVPITAKPTPPHPAPMPHAIVIALKPRPAPDRLLLRRGKHFRPTRPGQYPAPRSVFLSRNRTGASHLFRHSRSFYRDHLPSSPLPTRTLLPCCGLQRLRLFRRPPSNVPRCGSRRRAAHEGRRLLGHF